jgi:hypothetical protein
MTVVIGDHATVAESPLDQWKASRARAS